MWNAENGEFEQKDTEVAKGADCFLSSNCYAAGMRTREEIEAEFSARAVHRGAFLKLPFDAALDFVNACKEEKLQILGIDSFILTETTTQPTMEFSSDYTRGDWDQTKGYWDEALRFLESLKDKGFHFEVVVGQRVNG